MSEGRWRPALGPALGAVLGALGVGLLLGSAALDATGAVSAQAEVSPQVPGCDSPASGSTAWYQLSERSDHRGALSGYDLRFGSLAARAPVHSIVVPPESHAAGPFGGVLLYGTDDGRHSEVRLAVAASSCSSRVAQQDDVIRRSTINRAGTSLYFHLVGRGTRSDLGIWRQALGGRSPAIRVLPPAISAADDSPNSLGPVFSTEFAWDAYGASLAVQSCGATRCETRVLDTISGGVQSYAASDQGEMLGLTDASLVSYRACHGLPCPIAATDRSTGRMRDIVAAAEGAILADPAGGGVVLFERPVVGGYEIAALQMKSGPSRTVYRTAKPDVRLLAQASRSLAGASVRQGWVVLAPAQGLASGDAVAQVLRATDGARRSLREGAR
jgi:hypothetical protein